jgi:hypothetical protein
MGFMPQQGGGTGSVDMNALMQRLRRLATLDTAVFDDIRMDTTATLPALIVAAGATLLFGIGGWLWWVLQDYNPNSGELFFKSAILGSIVSLILWGVWIAITYVALTQIFRARADVNELVRVMGFAAAPLALGLLLFIPGLDFGIGLAAVALLFGTTVIGVSSATDAPGGRVLASVGLGFAVWALVLSLFVSSDYPWDTWAPNIFLFAPR